MGPQPLLVAGQSAASDLHRHRREAPHHLTPVETLQEAFKRWGALAAASTLKLGVVWVIGGRILRQAYGLATPVSLASGPWRPVKATGELAVGCRS